MDYLTKKTDNMRTKDRHKMTSYFFPVPKIGLWAVCSGKDTQRYCENRKTGAQKNKTVFMRQTLAIYAEKYYLCGDL